MESPNKQQKTGFIGLKIEPEYLAAYRELPSHTRKQLTEKMRQIVRDAVNIAQISTAKPKKAKSANS